MKLMTKELEKRFAKVGYQDGVSDKLIVARYFNPDGPGVWYATQYIPHCKEFFGYMIFSEVSSERWGYFRLEQLESYMGLFGVNIKRDLYFQEKPISQIIKK